MFLGADGGHVERIRNGNLIDLTLHFERTGRNESENVVHDTTTSAPFYFEGVYLPGFSVETPRDLDGRARLILDYSIDPRTYAMHLLGNTHGLEETLDLLGHTPGFEEVPENGLEVYLRNYVRFFARTGRVPEGIVFIHRTSDSPDAYFAVESERTLLFFINNHGEFDESEYAQLHGLRVFRAGNAVFGSRIGGIVYDIADYQAEVVKEEPAEYTSYRLESPLDYLIFMTEQRLLREIRDIVNNSRERLSRGEHVESNLLLQSNIDSIVQEYSLEDIRLLLFQIINFHDRIVADDSHRQHFQEGIRNIFNHISEEDFQVLINSRTFITARNPGTEDVLDHYEYLRGHIFLTREPIRIQRSFLFQLQDLQLDLLREQRAINMVLDSETSGQDLRAVLLSDPDFYLVDVDLVDDQVDYLINQNPVELRQRLEQLEQRNSELVRLVQFIQDDLSGLIYNHARHSFEFLEILEPLYRRLYLESSLGDESETWTEAKIREVTDTFLLIDGLFSDLAILIRQAGIEDRFSDLVNRGLEIIVENGRVVIKNPEVAFIRHLLDLEDEFSPERVAGESLIVRMDQDTGRFILDFDTDSYEGSFGEGYFSVRFSQQELRLAQEANIRASQSSISLLNVRRGFALDPLDIVLLSMQRDRGRFPILQNRSRTRELRSTLRERVRLNLREGESWASFIERISAESEVIIEEYARLRSTDYHEKSQLRDLLSQRRRGSWRVIRSEEDTPRRGPLHR